jgi:hypothetical protein
MPASQTVAGWLRDEKNNFLVRSSLQRSTRPDLANVAMALDFARTDEERTIMEIMFANGQFDRPVLAPPGLAPACLAALRAALKFTMEDADFKKEIEQSLLPIHYVSGEEVQALIEHMFASPPSVITEVEKTIAAQ